MQMADDYLSTAIVDESVRFAVSSLDCPASVFCWVDPDARVVDYSTTGISTRMMDEYMEGLYVHDPLNVYEIFDFCEDIAFLGHERRHRPEESNRLHDAFLQRYGVHDEVNFIFRDHGKPFALLAVLNGPRGDSFTSRLINWGAMRSYLEFTLRMHPRVRQARQDMMLTTRFGLTPREIQVVDLLKNGASNMTIAQIMGIGVATVKTYVINILNKLGVENRAAIIAFLARIQLP
ncbi:helix-turn-helix transcriptional regulator [Zavarzinia compransoris]|uniref:helix-turn-helix transcriptional regulator n=1 Tax=Zavarzinia marina TaxID=2911065 RepID=UPI001F1AD033|nr:helix-turn-helix transcriptional regulator [Zavarzinia marina]MCF4166752.1 helix-turn-helix transcriptional regulator [Zavarzinia marina]